MAFIAVQQNKGLKDSWTFFLFFTEQSYNQVLNTTSEVKSISLSIKVYFGVQRGNVNLNFRKPRCARKDSVFATFAEESNKSWQTQKGRNSAF